MDSNISHDLPVAPSIGLAWLVCIAASLFFFFEFIQMNIFNAISAELMQTFHMSAEKLGNLSAFYFYGDVVFLIPAGMILDRFSTRKVIFVTMVLAIIGTVFLGYANNFWFAGFARFLTGIGNAFSLLACVRLASRWFPGNQMALVVGVIVTIAMLGGVVAQTPTVELVRIVGWRHSLLIVAGLGVAILFIVMAIVRDYPKGHEEMHKRELSKLQNMGIEKSFLKAFANMQNWAAGIYTSFLNLAIFIMGALWGSIYLTQTRHLGSLQASNVVMMVFIGTIIGAPLVGWISDTIEQRKLPMIIGAICSFITILIILYVHSLDYAALLSLFFMLGFFTSTQVISYPLVSESNSTALSSTAVGISSVLIMAGGAVFQPLVGKLMDMNWHNTWVHNTPLYSLKDFNIALSVLPITFFIALIAACLVKETNCKQVD